MDYESTDPAVPFLKQMESDVAGSVILITTYLVVAEQQEAFLKSWGERAAMMRSQPGLLSVQMHRAIGGANVFVNYAVWESLAAFRNANANQTGYSGLEALNLVTRPLLVQKIALPGVCVA